MNIQNKLRGFIFICFLPAFTVIYSQINELPRSTPEAEGVPSSAIIALFDSLTSLPKTDIHSVMVVRHGKVIGEIYPAPFAPEYWHTMYSCSKTFVSAAVGLAIDDNKLRLTDRVATFFPEFLPDSISNNLADMTVRHLLTMGSGITPDWDMRNRHSDWIRTYLGKPIKIPGEKFEYDSMSTYLLSAIVQKVTGMTLLDYLKLKLFAPMNIAEVEWELSPEGINTGGWGLYIQSESLVKFGLLLLNKGVWKGKQLLSASWVKQMTSKQVETGSNENYGYSIWLCEYPGAVCVDGALGQYMFVIPDKDMIIVITECTLMSGLNHRRILWDNLLPLVENQALNPSKDYKRLQKKQHSYQLPMPAGKANSAVTERYAGKTIRLDRNKYGWQTISFQFDKNELVMTIIDDKNQASYIPFAYKRWAKATIDSHPPYSIKPIDRFRGISGPFWVAGSYAWESAVTLRLKIHYVNWISALDITLHFADDEVQLNIAENFSSEEVIITGKI